MWIKASHMSSLSFIQKQTKIQICKFYIIYAYEYLGGWCQKKDYLYNRTSSKFMGSGKLGLNMMYIWKGTRSKLKSRKCQHFLIMYKCAYIRCLIMFCLFCLQGTFQQMWISKQEYEESGKGCVERKCPWNQLLYYYSVFVIVCLYLCQLASQRVPSPLVSFWLNRGHLKITMNLTLLLHCNTVTLQSLCIECGAAMQCNPMLLWTDFYSVMRQCGYLNNDDHSRHLVGTLTSHWRPLYTCALVIYLINVRYW